jgi:hypothetical protein
MDDEVAVGFQSIYVLFSSFIIAILYFVWQSTQVREIPTVATLPMGNYGKTIFQQLDSVTWFFA